MRAPRHHRREHLGDIQLGQGWGRPELDAVVDSREHAVDHERVDVAAVVGFFPNLLVGPIMRATTLLPQIEQERRSSPAAATDLGRQAAAYVFRLTLPDSLPLWIQDLWATVKRHNAVAVVDQPPTSVDWLRTTAQALLCGNLFTATLRLRSLAPLDFIYFAF